MLVLQISALLPMWGGFFCTSAGVKPVLLATTDLALLLIMVCSGNASRCSSSTVTACATLQRDKHRQCMKWGIQKHLWMGRGIKIFLKKRIMRTWIVPASPLRGCASMHFEAFMAPIAQYTVRYSYSCTYALANEVCIYMSTYEGGGSVSVNAEAARQVFIMSTPSKQMKVPVPKDSNTFSWEFLRVPFLFAVITVVVLAIQLETYHV